MLGCRSVAVFREFTIAINKILPLVALPVQSQDRLLDHSLNCRMSIRLIDGQPFLETPDLVTRKKILLKPSGKLFFGMGFLSGGGLSWVLAQLAAEFRVFGGGGGWAYG